MKRKVGLLLMFLGLFVLMMDAGLLVYNRAEDRSAGNTAGELLIHLEKQLEQQEKLPVPAEPTNEMTVAQVDGQPCIGYLCMPTIERELPILAQLDDAGLKKAPCRYTGSTKTGDLVLAGHNYKRHFGPIDRLRPGDLLYFTDMDGMTTTYEVSDSEILAGTDVDKMVESDADLTLFTCNYSGSNRITVRCIRLI